MQKTKYLLINRSLKCLGLLALVLGLAACSNTVSTESLTSTGRIIEKDGTLDLKGVVADGYLEDATVCLDLNANKACEPSEPQNTSGLGGAYVLYSVTPIEADTYLVLVEVSTDVFDVDVFRTISKKYILTAPQGKETFVSPLTTMAQAQLESIPGVSINNIGKILLAKMGYGPDMPVSLYTDYIALEATGDVDAARLHKVAQVVATTLGIHLESVSLAVVQAGFDPVALQSDVVGIVFDDIVAQLPAIVAMVDAVPSWDPRVDVDAIAAFVVTNVTPSTVGDDMAFQQLASGATTIVSDNLRSVFDGGVAWLSSKAPSGAEPAALSYIELASDAQGVVTQSEYNYVPSSSGFNIDLCCRKWLLGTDNTWHIGNVTRKVVTDLNTNDLILVEGVGPPLSNDTFLESRRRSISLSTADIAGMNISNMLVSAPGMDAEYYGSVLSDKAAVFSAGAQLMSYTLRQTNRSYALEFVDDPQKCDLTATGNNCEAVEAVDGLGYVQALNEMIQVNPGDVSSLASFIASSSGFSVGGDNNVSLVAELLDGGTHMSGVVSYYEVDYLASTVTLLEASARWARAPSSEADLIVVDPPLNRAIRQRLWPMSGSRMVFAKPDAFVRPGGVRLAGFVETYRALNAIAMSDVVAAGVTVP